jgi:uncharacterized membrane protein
MKFPKWSLFVFPILAILLITMFPILAIVVAVSVATWVVIDAKKTAGTKPQDNLGLGENEVQAIAAPDGPKRTGPTQPTDADAA